MPYYYKLALRSVVGRRGGRSKRLPWPDVVYNALIHSALDHTATLGHTFSNPVSSAEPSLAPFPRIVALIFSSPRLALYRV